MEKISVLDSGIVSTCSCIGSGPPRFYLPYEPELPNSSYGQVIVNINDVALLPEITRKVERYFQQKFADAEPRVRLFPLGPSNKFKIEARFSGTDHRVLRKLALQAKKIMLSQANSKGRAR